jgi:hypothetical protein
MRERISRIQKMRVLITTGCLLNAGNVYKASGSVCAVSPGCDADKQYSDEQQDNGDHDG